MLTGQVSRSEKVASVHRLFRDGFASYGEFQQAIDEDRKEIVKEQQGFRFISGGQADWLDLLRPVAEHFRGFEKRSSSGEDAVGPVTRWFRTNTFYRMPKVTGKIGVPGAELSKYLPKIEGNGLLILPGPYSLERLVENVFYRDRKELIRDYITAISAIIPSLKVGGCSCILFSEPYVGYDLSRNQFDASNDIEGVFAAMNKNGIITGIHFPLVNGKTAIPLFENADVDFFGVDCIYSDLDKIRTQKDLLLGIVDGARAGIEKKSQVLENINQFLKNSSFSGNYYIGPNDRLFDVPFDIAIKKMKLLSEVSNDLGGKS